MMKNNLIMIVKALRDCLLGSLFFCAMMGIYLGFDSHLLNIFVEIFPVSIVVKLVAFLLFNGKNN